MFAVILLAVSLGALLVSYGIYPLAMRMLARRRGRPWRRDPDLRPPVTMVVAVYNEEAVLAEKLANFRALEYPPDRLTLLVGSDGSSDGTDALLRAAAGADARIRFAAFPRGGKLRTINRLMRLVETPFVVFSDANSMYEPDAIATLMQHFADDGVGAVCGNLLLRGVSSGVSSEGERTYWSWENTIKDAEARYATALGATGGIYAIRSPLFHPQPEDTQVADDLLLPLRIAADGYRVVYESGAVAIEETSPNMREDFRRKIRVARTSFNALPHIARVCSRYPLRVRVMLFVHKLLRWLGPLWLLLAAAGILLLPPGTPREVLLYAAAAVGVLTAAGWLADLFGRQLGLLSLPFFFIATNAALLIAWVTLPFRRPPPTWEPSVRGPGVDENRSE